MERRQLAGVLKATPGPFETDSFTQVDVSRDLRRVVSLRGRGQQGNKTENETERAAHPFLLLGEK